MDLNSKLVSRRAAAFGLAAALSASLLAGGLAFEAQAQRASTAPITKAPLFVRLLDRFPVLRRIPGRFIGLGVRRERVRSPLAAPASRP